MYLESKCKVYTRDDEEKKYFLDGNTDKFYTPDDLINSLELVNNRIIRFGNKRLINYVVYDLGQSFWFYALRDVSNLVHRIHILYNQQKNY